MKILVDISCKHKMKFDPLKTRSNGMGWGSDWNLQSASFCLVKLKNVTSTPE